MKEQTMKQSELVITVANLTGLSKSMIQEVLETASEVVADVIRTNPDEGVAFRAWASFRRGSGRRVWVATRGTATR
jgi:nucleoid DNA-binding protein